MNFRVVEGDCAAVLAELEPGCVDAVVTSPPYADQRGYGGSSLEGYGEWLAPRLAAMLGVVKPGGSLMLNVGRTLRDGRERPMAEDARRAAQEAGWDWVDTLIWSKPNGFYAASAPYLHNCHEYVWWMGRGADVYRGYDRDTRTPHAPDSLARFAQGFRTNRSKNGQRYQVAGKAMSGPHPDGAAPKSVVSYSVGGDRGTDHPAMMPLGLARHLVCLSCPAGGTVLDPFCGSGTTGIVALRAGRSFVGVDLSSDYCELARRRLADDAPLLNVEGLT